MSPTAEHQYGIPDRKLYVPSTGSMYHVRPSPALRVPFPDQSIVGPILCEPAADAVLGCLVRGGHHVRDRGLVASFQTLSEHFAGQRSCVPYEFGGQAQVIHPPTLTCAPTSRRNQDSVCRAPPPSLIQVSTTVSGLSEMLSIPCSSSHSARSG